MIFFLTDHSDKLQHLLHAVFVLLATITPLASIHLHTVGCFNDHLRLLFTCTSSSINLHKILPLKLDKQVWFLARYWMTGTNIAATVWALRLTEAMLINATPQIVCHKK